MEAKFGWTQISRAAVQRAELQLADATQGILDELGLLEIHQAYADRFFPGTSVLHTRLRYVLFVAWAYEDMLHHRTPPRNIEAEIANQERKIGIALKHNTDTWGVIGKRTLPRLPAQRPSMMYWSALGTWGLLHRHPDSSLPSQAEIHARLSGRSLPHELHDDEGRALQRNASPFIALPPRPQGWPGGSDIHFRLTRDEQVFLRELLGHVHVPGTDRLSLFARLANKRAGKRLGERDGLLCSEIQAVAGEDWPVLKRADQAASLAAVIRGAYLAMLEEQACRDGLGERNRCRTNLRQLMVIHRDKALNLDMRQLRGDLDPARRTHSIDAILEHTQRWLADQNPVRFDLDLLRDLYMSQERKRKLNRARLAPAATALRKEWWLDKAREKEEMPEPLHYRWHIARSLLHDLENRQ